MIANDRRADCSHTFRLKQKCQMYTRVVFAEKSRQTTWRISGGKFCCNLFLLLVLKRRQHQVQNRRKHRFWLRKIFMKRQDTLNCSPGITITGSQTSVSAICDRLRSYGNQPLTRIWNIVTLVIQFTIINDLFHNFFSL